MKKEYFILNLETNRYYCSFPDGFTLDVSDAVSFYTEEEAERRIDEILKKGQLLSIIPYYFIND